MTLHEPDNRLEVDPSSMARAPKHPVYTSWRQISGYFDGDGNVGLEVAKYVLRFRLRFIDTWRPQVEAVSGFLRKENLAVTNIVVEHSEGRNDAYRLEITSIPSVLRAAKGMVPFCAKKAVELEVVIDYLENKITGNDAVSVFNNEVLEHRRSGYLRQADLSLTRAEGIRTKELENASKARSAYTVYVDGTTQERIRNDHMALGLGSIRLSKKYGYSQKVIRRILGVP